VRPSSIANVLSHLISVKRPAFVWGPPGIGKSDVVAGVAKRNDMELVDVRMNLLDPVDLKGFPVPNTDDQQMTWLPPDFLPPMFVKEGKKMVPNPSKGILFLDEFNSAMPAVQAAGYQLVLNRAVGNYKLPDGWAIVAAGNREGDRGVTHRMPSPLANRLIHLDMETDISDWATWAVENGVSTKVLGYLRWKSGNLHAYDANTNPRAFPTPRSWVFVSDFIENCPLSKEERMDTIFGTIGPGVGGEFLAYLDIHTHVPKIEQILLNPKTTPVPEDHEPSLQYAVATELGMRASPSNFSALIQYIERMPIEFQIVAVRDAGRRDPAIAETKEFDAWTLKNSSVLV